MSMYKNLAPLRHEQHAGLRLLPLTEFNFAKELLIAPIVIDEIADAAREYPIVFPRSSALPAVLLGTQQGSNSYVAKDGSWKASYVPAHIRHYPFTLARIDKSDDGEDRLAVMIDVDSPMLSSTNGDPLFEDKTLSTTANRSVDLLRAIWQRRAVTRSAVEAIERAGLLVEKTIRVKRPGFEDARLSGLRVVDEKALNSLSDGAFNVLRKSGALPLVYAHLLSWANFKQGPIGRA